MSPHDPSSWIELRYASSQPLPEPSGLRDELDGITAWTVTAVRCFDDRDDEAIASSDVAVFDLQAGLDLHRPAAAYGGGIATAARLVLDEGGRVRGDVVAPLDPAEIDAFVLFRQVVIGTALTGAGLIATDAIRDRVATRRSLIGCLPSPPETDPVNPSFFGAVGDEVRQRWWDRGLFHLADGLWLLPPVAPCRGAAPPPGRALGGVTGTAGRY